MKLPKTRKKHCPYCNMHTEHKISQTKKKSPRSLSYGSKVRARSRGRARGTGNLGRYSKPAVTSWKMTGAKITKKTDLRFLCTKCNRMHNQRYGIRAKRVEFT